MSGGWHMHYASSPLVHRDGGGFCSGGTPVLVLDLAGAREQIARALADEGLTCGYHVGLCEEHLEAADAVIAALASQERGE